MSDMMQEIINLPVQRHLEAIKKIMMQEIIDLPVQKAFANYQKSFVDKSCI